MVSKRTRKVSKKTLKKIESILACISLSMDSEIDFDFFHNVMGLVWIETYGTVAGFELLNDFAHNCGDDVPTGDELWRCWCIYNDENERYFGMGQLIDLVQQPKKKKHKN